MSDSLLYFVPLAFVLLVALVITFCDGDVEESWGLAAIAFVPIVNILVAGVLLVVVGVMLVYFVFVAVADLGRRARE